MTTTKAESPQMEDPFLYTPQPTSKVQAVTQAGTRPSIHVSLYAYGGISAACMMSWVDLTATFARSDRQTDLRTIREDALISRSRCRATKWFLDSGKDVWIQLDHDIEFTAADVIRMAELAHEHQATICIPYSCRSLPARPALRPKAEHLHALKHQVNDAECAAELVPITMFASGCLAIPRKCLLATLEILEGSAVQSPYRIDWCEDVRVERFPTLWMPLAMESMPGKLEYLSEDYAAAVRMTLAGVKHLSMKPRKQLNHWGEFPFSFAPYAG
jgi:hypothetical protein